MHVLQHSGRIFTFGLVVGILVGIVSGCDNTIQSYKNRSDTYSIYGYLTENRTDQLIRVKRLEVLPSDQDGSLDVTVRLENRTDGTSETLRDSMITYEDEGSTVVTHNFWTDTPVRPETTYRLVLHHPDGDSTAVKTITPASVEAIARPNSGDCGTFFSVEFPPLEDPRRVVAAVFFDVTVNGTEIDLRVPQASQVGRDGTVFLTFQIEALIRSLEDAKCGNVSSDKIRISYTYLGKTWFGRIPRDSVIVDPIESPYIENGRGFFGSLWRDTVSVDFDG